ncbi:hypothetical protein [Acanthopleuribacter pedis]|uniref:Uncharacterized protein n=1 Tax=Acanthopleuribacter pedis TaxID=442870 RepID=A0A8J7U860_9BACT|nr:hypothetical protein [Acanthopleuribacter pedis]MBO1323233.1 hypothetical protein [Acanthopleuribacter pedis]
MITARPYDSVASFDQACLPFLEKVETLIPRLYTDHLGVPTWGIGFALVVQSGGSWMVRPDLKVVFEKAGIVFTLEQSRKLDELVNGCARGLNEKNPEAAFALIPTWRAGEAPDTNPTGLPLLSQEQAYALLKTNLPDYAAMLKGRFKTHLGEAAAEELSTALAGSHEAVALLSLTYNAPSLIGPGLTKALYQGDRAEAWFQIRYFSNGSKNAGLAKRRFYEAHQLGVLPEGTRAEAQGFQAMLARRASKIDPYERDFANQIDAANRDYDLSADPIETLAQIVAKANNLST